jgi:hypothetical protein
VALAFHLASDYSSVVSSLSWFSSSPSDRLSHVISSCVGSTPTSSSYSSGWYAPLLVSNLTYWMCFLYIITLLYRAYSSSYNSTKSMLYASSSTTGSIATVISCSSLGLKCLRNSVECSSPTICMIVSWKPPYGSRFSNQSSNIFNSIYH